MAEGFIKIHGKDYETVASRLARFRKVHPNGRITCEILQDDGKAIVMRASVGFLDVGTIATGHAEEIRGSSNINKTSALENCETSAIGRALAAAGFESGGSIASADEVEIAVARQAYEKTVSRTAKKVKEPLVTGKQLKAVSLLIEAHESSEGYLNEILGWAKCDHIAEMTQEQAGRLLAAKGVEA